MNVGITGHQDLRGAEDWIRETLRQIVLGLKVQHGLTSLAWGTDQIYAEILQELNLPYTAVIPCSQYESTFSDPKKLHNYSELLHRAQKIETLNFHKPEGIAFYEAGKKVVDGSEKMIAVWDGGKAKNLGGTADAVSYALSKRKEVIHLNPLTKTISIL